MAGARRAEYCAVVLERDMELLYVPERDIMKSYRQYCSQHTAIIMSVRVHYVRLTVCVDICLYVSVCLSVYLFMCLC